MPLSLRLQLSQDASKSLPENRPYLASIAIALQDLLPSSNLSQSFPVGIQASAYILSIGHPGQTVDLHMYVLFFRVYPDFFEILPCTIR
jgi:hypothetical protein